MSDASGFLALGQALDRYLLEEYSPPPGTQTALGFLPGIAVDPASFAPTGVVNPLAVQTFLNSVVNVLGPVVDGRFAGFMSAHQVYGMVIDVAAPVDPPGTPVADAFLAVKNTARQAFGASPVKQLAAVPLDWYDATSREGWSSFSVSSTEAAGEEASTSTGETPTPPHRRPPQRFGGLWRWRTLDEAAVAEVVVPLDPPDVDQVVVAEVPRGPVLVRDHRYEVHEPLVRDHRGVDLAETSVLDRVTSAGSVRFASVSRFASAAEPLQSRVLATVPRRQLLASLAEEQTFVAPVVDAHLRSAALAELIEVQTPILVGEIDGDAETSSTQSVESHDLSLSLEYCFVQVSRDAWWNDAVLRMPRWYAPGCAAGAFSSGSSVGGLPLGLPIAMVLTRNVAVTGRWSASDRAAAESHTSFGPWSTGDSQLVYDEAGETATLTVPGMQVVAVVCGLLPPLAPDDDPALPARTPA